MISIIIPIYNVEKYLQACLTSIIRQTHEEIEMICIDDGSTDQSLTLLEQLASSDNRITYISRANKGISASRNEALDMARGEWIMFVDSDDWIERETCATAIELAEKNQAELVLWGYLREYKDKTLPKLYCDSLRVWEKDIRELHRRIIGPYRQELSHPDTMDAWGTVWGKLYRRDIIEKSPSIRFVDTNLIGSAEDVLFNIDYMERIHKAVYVPKAMYHYRKITASYTLQYREGLPKKWNNLYKEIESRIEKNTPQEDFIEAFHNRVALGIIGLGLNEMFSKKTVSQKTRAIRSLITRPIYRESMRTLKLKWFSPQWKVFFFCAKHQLSLALYVLLAIIKKIILR